MRKNELPQKEKKIAFVVKKINKYKKAYDYWTREFTLLNKKCPHYNDMVCNHPKLIEDNLISVCTPKICPLH
jgi:hypothetical protein